MLLALSACLPQVQQDEVEQATQQPLDTAVPSTLTQPAGSTPIETITISPLPDTIPPSNTPDPTKETIMTTEPTSPPTNEPAEQPAKASTEPPANEQNLQPAVQNWIDQAEEDLSQRLGISTEEIELVSFENKVWSDSSLGCPQPSMRYLQVQKEGYLIRLRIGNELYNYHGSDETPPFLCEQASLLLPLTAPKKDEFIPPPGSDID